MTMKKKWANILVRKGMKPYKVIVTDGEWTQTIPVTNSKLETVKRSVKEIFLIPSSRILVTEILNDSDEHDLANPTIE
jgi:hypothetical protein